MFRARRRKSCTNPLRPVVAIGGKEQVKTMALRVLDTLAPEGPEHEEAERLWTGCKSTWPEWLDDEDKEVEEGHEQETGRSKDGAWFFFR